MENRIHTITEKTTLGELLEILQPGEKPEETPTPKTLRETVGEPVAEAEGCTIYPNGWAIYDNGSGYTVIWLPECVSFTYQFEKPKKNEDWVASVQETLPDGLLKSQPWPLALTLVGDHRVEENLMNRTGSRRGSKVFDDPDWDFGDDDNEQGDNCNLKRMFRLQEYAGESPETIYIRKETTREILACLTEKQRRVVVLYCIYGYKQREIARKLDISREAVKAHLACARRKIKKYYN